TGRDSRQLLRSPLAGGSDQAPVRNVDWFAGGIVEFNELVGRVCASAEANLIDPDWQYVPHSCSSGFRQNPTRTRARPFRFGAQKTGTNPGRRSHLKRRTGARTRSNRVDGSGRDLLARCDGRPSRGNGNG